MHWLITLQQTLSAASVGGREVSALNLGKAAILTFSRVIMERMETIVALVPPMGASPLSCILEELIHRGVKAIFWCALPGLSVLLFNLGI